MGYDIYPAIPAREDLATYYTKVDWSWNTGDVAISAPYLLPLGYYYFAPGILIQPVIQAFPYDITAARKMGHTTLYGQSEIDDLRSAITSPDQLFLHPSNYSGYWFLYGTSGTQYGFGFVDYPQYISGYAWQETSLCQSPGPEWNLIEYSAAFDFPYQPPVPRWDLFSVSRLDFWQLEWYWKEPVSWRWCLRWRPPVAVPPITSGRKSGIIPIVAGIGLLSALAMMGGAAMNAAPGRRARKKYEVS